MLDNMMSAEQLDAIKLKLSTIKEKSPFYREKYKDIDPTKIQTKEDFEKLPLTDKYTMMNVYQKQSICCQIDMLFRDR